jgi:hypothetical protein
MFYKKIVPWVCLFVQYLSATFHRRVSSLYYRRLSFEFRFRPHRLLKACPISLIHLLLTKTKEINRVLF